MFLVCTFLVFILTVQFKLGWRWKKDNKRWRNSWIIFLCICCTCYCWYCIWYSDSVLNHWNSVVCHIVVSWKKWSISLWFSQWWQRRLSYLNGFYHFCSYWYYTSVIEITWQKKNEIWKHVDAKANRNKHWLMYTVETLVFSFRNYDQLQSCVTAASIWWHPTVLKCDTRYWWSFDNVWFKIFFFFLVFILVSHNPNDRL